jgi:hypothetical protein
MPANGEHSREEPRKVRKPIFQQPKIAAINSKGVLSGIEAGQQDGLPVF